MKTFLLSFFMVVLCIGVKAQTTNPSPTLEQAAGAISRAPICSCNPTGWSPILTYIDNVKSYTKCGYQFGVKKGQVVKLNSTYMCSSSCAPKYSIILKKATGVILQNTTSSTMSWEYLFSEAGNFRLEVTPICNGSKCATCTFYFTVYP